MDATERRRIEKNANDTRVLLGLGPGRIDPFDALERASVAVLVYPYRKKAIDGAYRREADGSYATINSARPISRQRFTAAHELAHHVLDVSGAQFIDEQLESPTQSIIELRADEFAAAFLMDAASVNALVSDLEGSPVEKVVLSVAATFGVSVSAAAWRLVRLNRLREDEARAIMGVRRPSLSKRFMALGLSPDSAQTDRRRHVPARYHEAVVALRDSGEILSGAFEDLLNR